MTATDPVPVDPDSIDHELVDMLDAYLSGLQEGRQPDRARLLAARPQLAAAVECLEALNRFAEGAVPAQASPKLKQNDLSTVVYDEVLPRGGSAQGEPARCFGHYELLSELGRGGMGVVYMARDTKLGRIVALKMILAGELASADQLRRFAGEAQAAARLRHPHIVRLLDSGEVLGQPYFAMDFIGGTNLAGLLREGQVDSQTAARIVMQVAKAVDYLHHEGVIHRDLKPSNILLDGEGQSYVTDFGLARMLDTDRHLTRTGIAAGTPSYMAPEQAAGKSASVTPLCDVYSLGAILYELLTGRPPFEAESALDVLLQVLESEPTAPRKFNRAIPRSLELIALKCLEKSPDRRYPSAGDLALDLERFLRDEPVAIAPGLVHRCQRWAKRQPALAMRLAAFALFYFVEIMNYYVLHKWDWQFHYSVTAILFVWCASSVLFQSLMKRQNWATSIPFVWAVVDTLALLSLLLVGYGAGSPLIVAYPLLIAGAGLWLRVRLVWLTACLSVASYGVLLWDYYVRRPELEQQFHLGADHHVFVAIGLIVMGLIMGFHVRRARSLSRYLDHS